MNMPALAFSQLSNDESDRIAGMQKMGELWDRLQELEVEALTDPVAAEMIRDLEWPHNTWCRELLLGAAEANWESLPGDLLAEVQEASIVASTSQVVEHAFNFLRGQVEGVRNGKQGCHAIYHSLAYSDVPLEFELNPY